MSAHVLCLLISWFYGNTYVRVGNPSTLYMFVDERQGVQSVLLTALQMIGAKATGDFSHPSVL